MDKTVLLVIFGLLMVASIITVDVLFYGAGFWHGSCRTSALCWCLWLCTSFL